MTDTNKIDELLERWEQLSEQGNEISVEELCQDCPELSGEVRRRIAALNAMSWLQKSDTSGGEENVPTAWPKLPSQLGRYQLKALVGSGGFGQVWKAYDPELRRSVAIKIARPDRVASNEKVERFLDEARRVAQLKHPGIVPVHDAGRESGFCFIVSDFIEGGSLSDRLGAGRFSYQQAAAIVADVAAALHYAHLQEIVHRDVKSANIVLGEDDRPFVTDFGVAVHIDADRDHAGSTAGTLAYMAPEQVQGGVTLDGRSDVYSLGVVLYEMLTGRLPFTASDPVELRSRILIQEPRPLRTIDDSISPELERLCLKALSKSPTERFTTALDFANSLRAIATPTKRRRWPLWIGLTGILLIVGGSMARSWYVGEKRQAQETADQTRDMGRSVVEEPLEKLDELRSMIDDLQVAPTANSSEDEPAADGGSSAPLKIPVFATRIDATGHMLTDADVQKLRRHPVITDLVLARTNLNDAWLGQIAGNPILESLEVSGTQITDNGLKHLRNRLTLRQLNLANTKVSDEGLTHLRTLSLQRLVLTGTAVTPKGTQSLKESLRDCEIVP